MGSFIAPAANAVQQGFGAVTSVGGLLPSAGNAIFGGGQFGGGMLGGNASPGNSFSAQGPGTIIDPRQLGLTQGIQNSQQAFNQNFGSQQQLAGQLQAQAAGAGPNPAQLALQQGTNRAIQQNAGMLASQKGISPALAQRLAAQNAAGMSQQAAGQGAMMGAQQQMGAQNALGNLYGQMGNQQLSMNSNLQQALASFNNNQVGMQSNINSTNASVAAANSAQQGNMLGGVMQGASAAGMAALLANKGGEVPEPKKMAMGGSIQPQSATMYDWGYSSKPFAGESGPASFAGQYLSPKLNDKDIANAVTNYMHSDSSGSGNYDGAQMAGGPGDNSGPAWFYGDGPSPYAHPSTSAIQYSAKGGPVVPGKAEVSGDSLRNDKVPAMLSPKEIVLPRSVTMHPEAPRKAAEFVAAVKAGKRPKGKAA